MLALTASVLESDTVHIWHSGESAVRVTQGIPEGGAMGNLLYTSLPDTLVKRLLTAGFGMGWYCYTAALGAACMGWLWRIGHEPGAGPCGFYSV